ncbi:disease resistance protein Roq1-like isoform X2 [Cryptomeria japonica]|uniref:disease resistance protein Roq1-like isoform X2 n=1 Tax=Cryptomeria japonica TaxID=3369 RepID=UPI0027DA6D2F|nr:disease resistance protein Roq1-like isoform X2 [Cryptomeria japonica]
MARGNEITNSAFAEIMAPSASSSNPTKKVRYDVFINHRGPDTKQTLAASIYRALKLMGLRVFLDEPELDLGDSIPSEIQHAIATSFLHIAILSPTYAESTWCLEELSLMLKTGQTIIPLFYNVDINHIRWIRKGDGPYAEAVSKLEAKAISKLEAKAISKLEAKERYSPEKIEDWKSTLEKVSYLKGYIVNSKNDEEVLKIIKNYVMKQSKKTPFVMPKHLVGLDKILQDFERSVLQSSKYVKIVGITGMSGCGKSTLAKQYYNKMIQSSYRCSFLFDVSTKNLCEMQKKMFQDLGGSEDVSFDSVEEGKAILREYLSFVQVFIILDNVDHLDQLESLLPIKDNLGHGSVVVVISQNSHIFTLWGIPSDSIFKMKEFNSGHSMELFCWHSFGKPSPEDGFECLVSGFLKFCHGLPLAVKVLGGLVRGKSKACWASQLDKVSKSLPKGIRSLLQVSFDALDEEEEKEIFLDISCFFIGTEKDSAIAVWDASKWSGECSLQILVDKFLVEIDGYNCLRMHDLLRDLGRDISETKSPYRLWSSEQITHIEEKGEIRGIKIQTEEVYKDFVELVQGPGRRLKRKQGLKILHVENNYLTEELAAQSEGLLSLRWAKFPHTAIPAWISLKKLRVLELCEASNLEEPWRDSANPPVQLEVLRIIHAGSFLRFPRSIGFLKHLKNIYFDGQGAPIEGLPDEFCCLQSLERLELVGCDELKSLPSKFGDLTNLQHLILKRCRGIEGLPEDFACLQSLKELVLSNCHKLKALPSKFSNLTNLWVTFCSGLRKIEGLENCTSLEVLILDTRAKMPNMMDMESLRWVNIMPECHRLSACGACLQTINREKWPSGLTICVKSVAGVEAIVKSISSPALTLVDSFHRRKRRYSWSLDDNYWRYVFLTERPANAAAMICLVIDSKNVNFLKLTSVIDLNYYSEGFWPGPNHCETYLWRGKRVCIGVFTASSLVGSQVSFSLGWKKGHAEEELVEMGILVMGEESEVVDAFYQLVQDLGKAQDICEAR